MTAEAIICVYNEEDILEWVIRHLIEQGVGVYVVDNWSTDRSVEIARSFPLIGFEKFPADRPSPYYSWRLLLQRVERLALESKADWVTHHDADEIRRSPRPNETLLQGFERVSAEGYNAVNFQVYHFLPVDDTYAGDPENHFKHYTTDHDDCKMRQVKAWRNLGVPVDLAETGGHYARFPGVKVHPEKFILKHYPLRSCAQAERKVIRDRWNRYDPVERARGWHVQYTDLAVSHQWLRNPKELAVWR